MPAKQYVVTDPAGVVCGMDEKTRLPQRVAMGEALPDCNRAVLSAFLKFGQVEEKRGPGRPKGTAKAKAAKPRPKPKPEAEPQEQKETAGEA